MASAENPDAKRAREQQHIDNESETYWPCGAR